MQGNGKVERIKKDGLWKLPSDNDIKAEIQLGLSHEKKGECADGGNS